MGTRADFYVGRGPQAEWLGSIAMDGYPEGNGAELLYATSEQQFRERVESILAELDHSTRPEQGWPWPWKDSRNTDYAYAWDQGVWISNWGYRWAGAAEYRASDPGDGGLGRDDEFWGDEIACVFPDMASRQNVTMGRRSGLILVRFTGGR